MNKYFSEIKDYKKYSKKVEKIVGTLSILCIFAHPYGGCSSVG